MAYQIMFQFNKLTKYYTFINIYHLHFINTLEPRNYLIKKVSK